MYLTVSGKSKIKIISGRMKEKNMQEEEGGNKKHKIHSIFRKPYTIRFILLVIV